MKTVEMTKDYSHRVSNVAFVQYKAGQTYKRVPEAAARDIVAAGAGRVVTGGKVSGELARTE